LATIRIRMSSVADNVPTIESRRPARPHRRPTCTPTCESSSGRQNPGQRSRRSSSLIHRTVGASFAARRPSQQVDHSHVSPLIGQSSAYRCERTGMVCGSQFQRRPQVRRQNSPTWLSPPQGNSPGRRASGAARGSAIRRNVPSRVARASESGPLALVAARFRERTAGTAPDRSNGNNRREVVTQEQVAEGESDRLAPPQRLFGRQRNGSRRGRCFQRFACPCFRVIVLIAFR